MQRFFDHWSHYVSVSQDARDFLRQRGKVIRYKAGSHFKWADEPKPYWCFVLEGLAFGYVLYSDGHRRIRWFAPPLVDFMGTRHLHTHRGANVAIQFALATTLMRIPLTELRMAKHRYHEVSELLHVLKQKRIDQRESLIEILQQPQSEFRFAAFMERFRSIARHTSPEAHMDFVNMGHGSYYRAKNDYLRSRSSKK